MSWRIVVIENPSKLKLRQNQLLIAQTEEISLPIEDLDVLIIDSYGITISAELLSFLATHKVTVILCDEKHLPCGEVLSYSQHSRQAKNSRDQLAMTVPLKKRLWQKNILAKITNQADVLKYFNIDDTRVRDCLLRVRSGDISNQESVAARIYFEQLLGDATRRQPVWHNAALNFGYAIIRSHIARHVAARGLVSAQGIFHHNELNSFNLVDDLIESYRPVVDLFLVEYALINQKERDANLNSQDRKFLIDIFNKYVIIKSKRQTIKYAIELTVESFIECIKLKDVTNFALPEIIF